MLSSLFSPLRLGPVELQNRIVSTAHQTTLVHDHLPTDDFVAYHEARARGGAGLIVLEATAPHPSGILTAHELGGLPARDRRRATGASAMPSSRTGRASSSSCSTAAASRSPAHRAPRRSRRRRSRASASASRLARCAPTRSRRSSQGFGDAARLAADGGLDGVEISAAHRYLVAQFFDPELNRRDDEWAEPSRFLLAVVRAVRAAAPGLCLGVRLSADSEPARRMAPLLAGRGRLPQHRARRVALVPRLDADRPAAAAVRTARSSRTPGPFRVGLPLIATSRVVDVSEADAIVASGAADALGMTRALITDPDLPAKARPGARHEIVRCIGCQACIAHYHADDEIRCAINPRTGRERTWRDRRRPRRPTPRGRRRGGPGRVSRAPPPRSPPVTRSSCSTGPSRVGGQLAARRRAPRARSAIAEGFLANHARTLDCRRPSPRHRGDARLGDAHWRRTRSSSPPARGPTSPTACRSAETSARRGRCSPATSPRQPGRRRRLGRRSGRARRSRGPRGGRQRGHPRRRLGDGRRERPPVPAQPLPAAALPRGRDDPPAPRADGGEPGEARFSQRLRPRARDGGCRRTSLVLALGRVPDDLLAPALRRPVSRSRRPATASRRGRSRRPCWRERSPRTAPPLGSPPDPDRTVKRRPGGTT